jgi:hypothetical protein
MNLHRGRDQFAELALSLPVAPWYDDWAWGLPLIVSTVIIHVLGLYLINKKAESFQRTYVGRGHDLVLCIGIISVTVLSASVLHGIEAIIWACVYQLVSASPDYSSVVLYSLGAMTTYGHSNLVLEGRWQLLGALEALNGMLLFGFTTAFLIQILQKVRRLYDGESS